MALVLSAGKLMISTGCKISNAQAHANETRTSSKSQTSGSQLQSLQSRQSLCPLRFNSHPSRTFNILCTAISALNLMTGPDAAPTAPTVTSLIQLAMCWNGNLHKINAGVCPGSALLSATITVSSAAL